MCIDYENTRLHLEQLILIQQKLLLLIIVICYFHTLKKEKGGEGGGPGRSTNLERMQTVAAGWNSLERWNVVLRTK